MKTPSTLVLGLAVLIAIAAAVGAAWSVNAAARPSGYNLRLAGVEASLAEIERTGSIAPATRLGATTLCAGPVLAAAPAIRNDLVRRAAARSLTVKSVAAGPGLANGRLAAIDVSLVAEGPYEGATAFLADLQVGQPEVFIDSASVKPVAGALQLSVRGRAFCSTSARR